MNGKVGKLIILAVLASPSGFQQPLGERRIADNRYRTRDPERQRGQLRLAGHECFPEEQGIVQWDFVCDLRLDGSGPVCAKNKEG